MRVKDNRLFRTVDDVYTWFGQNQRSAYGCNHDGWNRVLAKGINIDTKLRRELLTGEQQGKLLNGTPLIFKNIGGGVWNVSIDLPFTQKVGQA